MEEYKKKEKKEFVCRLGYCYTPYNTESKASYFLIYQDETTAKNMFVPSSDYNYSMLCLVADAVEHLPSYCKIMFEYSGGKLEKLYQAYSKPKDSLYRYNLSKKKDLVKYIKRVCFSKSIDISFRMLGKNEFLAPNGILLKF